MQLVKRSIKAETLAFKQEHERKLRLALFMPQILAECYCRPVKMLLTQ